MKVRATLAAAVVCAFVATGCTAATQDSLSITVDALWVAEGEGDTSTSGIAPVTISATNVSGRSDQQFSVDLETERAQGAGPAWESASATAAATAAMFSGRDPRTIHLSFSIDGPIDGPSAGALLTVGSLAILRGATIRPDVSMTGTISPDGSVGMVSGIANKIRAAAAADIKTVLIPVAANEVPDDQTRTTVDPVKLGQDAGVTITRVATVGQAMQIMTGQSLFDGSQPSGQVNSGLQNELSRLTRALTGRLMESSQVKAALSSRAASSAQTSARRARELLARGDTLAAYATAWAGLRSVRIDAARRTATAAAKTDSGGLQRSLTSLASAGAARAASTVEQRQAPPNATAPQLVAGPSVLSWGDWASAELATYAQRLGSSQPVPTYNLPEYAAAIAAADFNSSTSLPDASAGVTAMTGGQPASVEQQELLESYQQMLLTAGQFNEKYYASVITSPSASEALPDISLETLQRLGESAATTDSAPPSQRLGSATTYYLASTALVVSSSIFLAPFSEHPAPLAVGRAEALRGAIATGAGVNYALAGGVQSAGFDPSLALWATVWGTTVAGKRTDPLQASAALTGLTVMWFGTVQLLMLESITQLKAAVTDPPDTSET